MLDGFPQLLKLYCNNGWMFLSVSWGSTYSPRYRFMNVNVHNLWAGLLLLELEKWILWIKSINIVRWQAKLKRVWTINNQIQKTAEEYSEVTWYFPDNICLCNNKLQSYEIVSYLIKNSYLARIITKIKYILILVSRQTFKEIFCVKKFYRGMHKADSV